ncbi:MAG: pectinesterase family protein [Thermoplasmatota archaeon]
MNQAKVSIIIGCIIILSLISSGCFEETTSKEKNTLFVDSEGNEKYTSIQQAIDDAPENYTIYVYPGVYNETITINKTIMVMGENPEETIIDGNHLGDVITIHDSDSCNVSGFTLQNSKSNGAGIELKTSKNNVTNNIIKNCYNGIHCNRVEYNSIFNNTFRENTNYAIYIYNSNYNIATKNVFIDNSYGMRIKGSRHNKVIANHFQDNDHGMYFCCGATNNVAYYNNFINNSVWNGDDYVGGNTWYNEETAKGNYWDDYTGSDDNADGIGDTPYNITSDGTKKDNYPLMEPIIQS